MSNDPSSQQPQSSDKSTSQPSLNLSTIATTTTTNTNTNYLPTYPPNQYLQPELTSHQNQDSNPYLFTQYPSNEMMSHMSHRDMGYGYMPQAIPSYTAAQSYHSTLAPLPGYYQDTFRQLSTSPQTTYLSNPTYPRYTLTASEDREQIQKRRRRNSTERRHHAKLASRKTSGMQSVSTNETSSMSSRLPSIMGTGLDESPVQTTPIDMFTTQAPLQTSAYITESFQRAASYERSPSLRDDYRLNYNMSQSAMSEPPSFNTAYSMSSIGASMSSLAPPPSLIPSPSPSHQTITTANYPLTARSSPLLMPTSAVSPHPGVTTESLLLDHHHHHSTTTNSNNRRDKPQCWDHGCNGREFSTFSNLLRHQREKSGSAAKAYCPRCGAEFTRTTARNGHMEHGKCKGRRASATSIGGGGSSGIAPVSSSTAATSASTSVGMGISRGGSVGSGGRI